MRPQAISRSPSPFQPLPGRDYFSSLPHEIILCVLEMVDSQRPLLPVVNKRLLPFNRHELYREVRLRSQDQLALFVRTLQSNPGLGLYVKSFAFEELRSYWSRREDEEVQVDLASLTQALATLSDVEVLSVDGPSDIIRAVFSFDKSSLLKLSQISLKSDFAGFEDPFDLGHFASLASCPALNNLSIVMKAESGRYRKLPPPRSPPDDTYPEISFPSVQSLAIEGPLTSYFSTHRFIARFNPIHLTIFDKSEVVPLASLVSTVQNPQLVQTLSIGYGKATSSLGNKLRAFSNLASLALVDMEIETEANLFLDSLRILPLHTLTLGLNTYFDKDELISFISDSTRHPTLETLVLNTVKAKEGTYINIDDWRSDQYETDWELPFMETGESSDETFDDIWDVRRAARANGIETRGTSIEGCEIEAKWFKAYNRAQRKHNARSSDEMPTSSEEEEEEDESEEASELEEASEAEDEGSDGEENDEQE